MAIACFCTADATACYNLGTNQNTFASLTTNPGDTSVVECGPRPTISGLIAGCGVAIAASGDEVSPSDGRSNPAGGDDLPGIPGLSGALKKLEQPLEAGTDGDEITLYHGTSLESAQGLLRNPALDAGKAAAGHIDGPSGFHLATEAGDAEYFALRRSPGVILEYNISEGGVQELMDAGAIQKDIPGTPPPYFEGQEIHIPLSAFDTFNSLVESGDIRVTPYHG